MDFCWRMEKGGRYHICVFLVEMGPILVPPEDLLLSCSQGCGFKQSRMK